MWRINQAKAVSKVEDMGATLPLIRKAYSQNNELQDAYAQVAWMRYIPEDWNFEKTIPYVRRDQKQRRLSNEWQINYAQALMVSGSIAEAVVQIEDAYHKNPELKNGYASCGWWRYFTLDYDPESALKWFESVDESFFENWRSDRSQAGGGILMDQGIHMLDLLMFFANGFDEVKSFCSNLYWNLDVEDNVFAVLKNNQNNIVASLHSTMTQWRHLFALEIFLEKGYMVINGLITSSMSYTTPSGKEVLTIATNRNSAPPQAMHASEQKFVYSEDSSWQSEMNAFFYAIENDTPIPSGTSKDSLELMQTIEQIYQDGDCPGKMQ